MHQLPHFNPAEPAAVQTYSGWDHSGWGTGIVPSVPTFLELVTGPAGDLPTYPEAVGTWLLRRVDTESVSFLEAHIDLFGRSVLLKPLWMGGPGGVWRHGILSLVGGSGESETLLSLSWWTWMHPFSGIDTGLPPVYGNLDDADGGYHPLHGQLRERRRTVDGIDDGMPGWVFIGPWFP